MLGRSSARYGRPTAFPHLRLRSFWRTATARGLAAALLAAGVLITVANVGPARAASDAPSPAVVQGAAR
ncbi:hypothetical protein ACFC09_10255 [Streptomyces sp. NPDC056161]|uniref:hypothetical protein n=1 Tax=Streptomyces sp. NPDC056161 TaxID=3345732 RepID=UPI0035DEB778